MEADGKTNVLIAYHQGEFQHQFFTLRSVHDSDHGGVVRIFVGQSQTIIGVSLSEPHTSVTSLHCACVCLFVGWILQLP